MQEFLSDTNSECYVASIMEGKIGGIAPEEVQETGILGKSRIIQGRRDR
jgi:hypothetical protein